MESPFQFHKEVAQESGPIKTVKRRPIMLRRAGLVLAALLIGLLIVNIVTGFFESEKANAGKTVPVTEAVAQLKAMPVQITTIGHVEPIATVAVRPRVDGEIAAVPVTDGQQVKKGDLLFQLDDRQARAALDVAVANLSRDHAQLDFARKEVERQRGLAKKDFVSRSQFDQAQSTADALTGTVAADEAQVANMQAALSFTAIAAPIDGRIGSISIREGNTVEQNSAAPLLTINQISPIYVNFTVPQGQLGALREAFAGGAVTVAAQPTGDDRPPSTGTIAFYENTIDAQTGTLGIRGTFPNEDERLWPGQFVNVTVTLRVEAGAVTVPMPAVQMSQNGSYVFVIKPDKTVELRQVTVSRTVNDNAVIASGLKAGEHVVTSGQLRLVPGAKIRVADDPPALPKEGVAAP